MRHGTRRILIASPCGSGKTCLVAQVLAGATARGRRAWFLVHRVELVRQSVETFREAADIETGIIAAGFPETPAAPVQVCSIQSLARRMSTHTPPDLLVTDEVHHACATSWAKILTAFPNAYQIGLTATPQRLDGRGLGQFFDELLCGPSTADLIAQGFLSPYELYAPSATGPELDGVTTTAGDYNKAQLADVMGKSTVTGDALAHYQQHCPTARALVFVWSVEASKALAQRFVDAGVPAVHIDGETPREARELAMASFRTGGIRVVCNVDLFGEGLDVPAVDAVFLLRPTQSLGLYLQQIGRGLRPAPGKMAVKVFDHAGNWQRFGLPDQPREWALNMTRKKAKAATIGVRRCPICFAVSPVASEACVVCRVPFEKKPRHIEQVNGVLQAWRAMSHTPTPVKPVVHGVRGWSLSDWQREAKRRGYRPGWAFFRWQAQQRRIISA